MGSRSTGLAVKPQEAAIELLRSKGWEDAGRTASETVRIPTMKAPVFGGIGGEVRTFGGRLRLVKGEIRRVTVGPRTVNFYEMGPDGRANFHQAKTKDLEKIGQLAD
jgi:hypothetical protein